MRSLKTGSALVVLAAGMLQVAGCFNSAEDPERNPKLGRGSFADLSGSGGASFSSSTGTGELPPECAGDPTKNATLVSERCGVFVRADAAGSTEDGTQDHPYRTLQKALDSAGPKRVYACSIKPYSEAVTVSTAVEMYGSFECVKGWTWTAGLRSALNGPSGAVTLTLGKQAAGAKVQGFSITAADATAKGGSSVAVAVDDIAATLMNCEVTAGDGMPGKDGVTPAGIAPKGTDAPLPDAVTMNACINPAALVGGPAGVTTCADGMTAGGIGGKGEITAVAGGHGATGANGTPADMTKGKGGTGEDGTNECADGSKGKSGDAGQVGDSGLSPGALSLNGISDTSATDGKPGSRGYGGGGGGGAKAGVNSCAPPVDGNGASGGGGGAGGCGGKGGGGGKAGGSSVAIVSLGMKLKLTDVSLKTGKGGKGGQGASGQLGGVSGAGAFGGAGSGSVKAGCKGGDGGVGGLGGPGGGGRGGHSVGIAYTNAPIVSPVLEDFIGNMAGPGGTAGPNNMTGEGAPGAAGACWDFGKNAACAP